MPWIEANGAWLRYELSGSGSETLVLMHEAGGCLESFDEAMPALNKEFRVLRYDQRGFGFSEKIRELSLDVVANDLAGLLDALQITKPVLAAGFAMGSDLLVAFATRHPNRVAKLLLASPNIGPPGEARVTRNLDRASLVEREGMRAAMDMSQDVAYPEHLRARDPERFRRYRARWLCNTPASFTAIARMMSTVDLENEYPKLKTKTLVIGAKHDTQRNPEKAQRIAKSIRGAIYEEADSGHFMNVQTPELFAATAIRFFKGS